MSSAKLRLQKVKLESLVRQFQNNNEDFRRIKELVNQAVKQSLTNHRHILKIAFLSVIDSCRRDPLKFNILYHNLPATARTTETQIFLSDQNNQYNYELSAAEQLCYQDNNNDDVYWEFLIDEAERLFNLRVKELTQICLTRLGEACISTPISSQLAIETYSPSEVEPSSHTYENGNTHQLDKNSK